MNLYPQGYRISGSIQSLGGLRGCAAKESHEMNVFRAAAETTVLLDELNQLVNHDISTISKLAGVLELQIL